MKTILVRANNDGGYREFPIDENGHKLRWHLADPDDGCPILGEFANTYREFTSKRNAIEFVRKHGFVAVFE